MSPAMAARLTETLWDIGDIVKLIEAWEARKFEGAWTGQKTVQQAISDDETALKSSLGDKIIIR